MTFVFASSFYKNKITEHQVRHANVIKSAKMMLNSKQRRSKSTEYTERRKTGFQKKNNNND